MKTYTVNEIFMSLQGEGKRAGDPSFFLRFSRCNMRCDLAPGPLSPGGFACDTEFESGRKMTLDEILKQMLDLNALCRWIVLTGGEPGLQVDKELVDFFHKYGFKLAIETNGTIHLGDLGLDWITVSPKCAEHAIKQKVATEVKYVRAYGQGIPRTVVEAEYYLLSPAFSGQHSDKKTIDWVIKLAKENPSWSYSEQLHKKWMVR